MHYLARLLAEPGREFHVLDLVAAERALRWCPPGRDDGDPGRGRGTPARCSMPREGGVPAPAPRDRRGHRGGHPRWGTATGPPSPRPTATTWSTNSRAFGLGGRYRLVGSSPSARGPASRGRCATPSRASPTTTPVWRRTSARPCAPGRTAATHPIRAGGSTGRSEEPPRPSAPGRDRTCDQVLGSCSSRSAVLSWVFADRRRAPGPQLCGHSHAPEGIVEALSLHGVGLGEEQSVARRGGTSRDRWRHEP